MTTGDGERQSTQVTMRDDLLEPYLSPDQREAEVAALAGALSGELRQYGQSVEGRALQVVRVPARGGEARARVLVTANIHGVELIGGFVALHLLRSLQRPEGHLEQLARDVEIWIAPCLNPDGYARTWEQRGQGRLVELRTNANGVDLNRNFPLPTGAKRSRLPFTGSNKKGDATYRGEGPLSEPESASLAALLDEVPFAASVNLHSTMGTLIPARCTDLADYESYAQLCREFRSEQRSWRYVRLASRYVDAFTGELEDFQHHRFGTWAVCVEVFPILASLRQHLFAPSTFWRFNPREPMRWAENDAPGVARFLLAAVERGPPGAPVG